MLWYTFVPFSTGAGWTYVVILIIIVIISQLWAHRTGKLYE
ncbi:MAG: hypothetical protein ACXVHM_07235 [Methanobacterium sp.]